MLLPYSAVPGLAVHLAAVGQRGRGPGEHDLPHHRPQRVEHRLPRARRRRARGVGADDLDRRGRGPAGDRRRRRAPAAPGSSAPGPGRSRSRPWWCRCCPPARCRRRCRPAAASRCRRRRTRPPRRARRRAAASACWMKVVLHDCAKRLGERHGARGRTGPGSRTPGPRPTVVPGQATGVSGRERSPAESSAVAVIVFMARAGRELAGQRVARVGRLVGGDREELAGARADDDQVGGQGLARRRRRRRRSAPPGTSGVCTGRAGLRGDRGDLAALVAGAPRRCSPPRR